MTCLSSIHLHLHPVGHKPIDSTHTLVQRGEVMVCSWYSVGWAEAMSSIWTTEVLLSRVLLWGAKCPLNKQQQLLRGMTISPPPPCPFLHSLGTEGLMLLACLVSMVTTSYKRRIDSSERAAWFKMTFLTSETEAWHLWRTRWPEWKVLEAAFFFSKSGVVAILAMHKILQLQDFILEDRPKILQNGQVRNNVTI